MLFIKSILKKHKTILSLFCVIFILLTFSITCFADSPIYVLKHEVLTDFWASHVPEGITFTVSYVDGTNTYTYDNAELRRIGYDSYHLLFANVDGGDPSLEYEDGVWFPQGWSEDVVDYTTIQISINDPGIEDNTSFYSWWNVNFKLHCDPTITVNEFGGFLVGGISSLASGIGSGINSFVSNIFLAESGGLSTFGYVIAIFGAAALACSLTYLLFRWIRGIGG